MQVRILSGIYNIVTNMSSLSPDFGNWRPNILIIMTLLGVAVGFSWLGVHTPDKWMSATALYILGSELQFLTKLGFVINIAFPVISFQLCWTFWVAA